MTASQICDGYVGHDIADDDGGGHDDVECDHGDDDVVDDCDYDTDNDDYGDWRYR